MKFFQHLGFYFIIVLIAVCNGACGQGFDSTLQKLNNNYRQEKIYLHFDRAVYAPGETIWFKAYLFAGIFQSSLSKTVYAELLDANGKVLQRKTTPVVLSSASGSFEIPAFYTGSNFVIRAYTKWMLNFDSAYLFSKAIPVLQTTEATVRNKPAVKSNSPVTKPVSLFYLQFFPEGGDLVEQVVSKVAFKATYGSGLPASISGNVLDSKKNKVAVLTTLHDGMGVFTFEPKAGEKYSAVWKDPDGQLHETQLPVAKQNGIVLEVTNNSAEINFKVSRPVNAEVPYPFVYVVAHLNQELVYRAKANLPKSTSPAGTIPSEYFPTGIVQITVFSPDEKPLAERITFINPSASTFITDLNVAVKDLNKRKKNTIQVDVPDTILTNLSVAITDAELDPASQPGDIFSNVFLTSEIKGYVHNPAYYFSSEADSVQRHLDLVMMTNGWRRFRWEEALAGKFPVIKHQPENYLTIEGRMYGVNKTLMANREINGILQFKNGNKQFMNTRLEPDGRFTFPAMVFYDTAKLFYQLNDDKKAMLTTRASFDVKNSFLKDVINLEMDSSLLLSIPKNDNTVVAKNKVVYEEVLKQQAYNKVKVLQDVIITSRKKTRQEILEDEYTNGFFSGGNATVIVPDDDMGFASAQNVLQYLQGRVAGLQINGADFTVTWRGSATSLFLNELASESTVLQNISMADVAMVKIFPPPFFGAFGGGAGGAIAVYQKKGAAANQAIRGMESVPIYGYNTIKEFYSPDHSKMDETENADLRKTLYWNPFVITDRKNRRIYLSFYNNDISKKFRVIIEGFNEEGKLTRVEKIIQ